MNTSYVYIILSVRYALHIVECAKYADRMLLIVWPGGLLAHFHFIFSLSSGLHNACNNKYLK